MSLRWQWLLIAVFALSGASSSSRAQGPLRRLFIGPPRSACLPAPPPCVQIEPAPAPKEAIAKEQEPWGTLQGRVVWKGDLPNPERLGVRTDNDREYFLKAPKELLLDPTWRIDPKTRGVANVAVYFKRVKDATLPIHPDDKIRKNTVAMETPYTIFTPHVVAVYPEWFDGKERGETGQKFVIKNTSGKPVNVRSLGNPAINPGFNRTVPPGQAFEPVFKPQSLPITLIDDIYTRSDARVWGFDHPYFAISKADGSFTIPRVPADIDVHVMAWHEAQGWLLTKNGTTMILTRGKNTLDIEMSAK